MVTTLTFIDMKSNLILIMFCCLQIHFYWSYGALFLLVVLYCVIIRQFASNFMFFNHSHSSAGSSRVHIRAQPHYSCEQRPQHQRRAEKSFTSFRRRGNASRCQRSLLISSIYYSKLITFTVLQQRLYKFAKDRRMDFHILNCTFQFLHYGTDNKSEKIMRRQKNLITPKYVPDQILCLQSVVSTLCWLAIEK